MAKEHKLRRGSLWHDCGFNSVMSVGLTGKYGQFAWTVFKRIGDVIVLKNGGAEHAVVTDWGTMVNDVVEARNNGLLDDGEMMGVLWFYTTNFHNDFVGLIEKEKNNQEGGE